MFSRRQMISSLVSLATLAAVSPCWAADVSWHHDVEAAWKEAREQQRPLLVFVTTSGCRYCTMMRNVTFTDSHVANVIEGGFVAAAVDAKDVGWMVKDQKITSFPTTLVISTDAEVVDRIKGFVKPNELAVRLSKTSAGDHVVTRQQAPKK